MSAARSSFFDALEEAWMVSALGDVPAASDNGELSFLVFKIGQAVEAERPGLLDRLTDRLVTREAGYSVDEISEALTGEAS